MTELKQPNARLVEPLGFTNRILLALPHASLERIKPFLEPLIMEKGQLIDRMNGPIKHMYFVNRGLVSVVKTMRDGRTVEIGAVGIEGVTPTDAVEIARLLHEAGVDICDVSAGHTSALAKAVYGRMFQTPFSDRIRNEVGMATMAVGNIYEPDHVNSILMAGRADLVALARPHLADPYWTLHAAVTLGDRGVKWPDPYLPGRDQLYRLAERDAAAGLKV